MALTDKIPGSWRRAAGVFAAAGLIGLCGSCGKAPATADAGNPGPPPAATQPRPEFQRLVGKWVRPDGGYVLEIRSVAVSGAAEAAYFNPNPIHVARAAAIVDAGKTKLFVELRDVNYPGCTYSLQYEVDGDQLYGEYFQAALGQTFDVTFARVQTQP